MAQSVKRDEYVVCPACKRYVRKGRMAHHIERECPGHVRCATVKEKKR